MQLVRVYESTGYQMHDLLKMPISEFNSILFSIVGIGEQKKKDIEEMKRNAKIK